MELLVDDVARDTALLHRHEKGNAEALADRWHPDFYSAHAKAAVVARRISANLKKAIPLKTRGIDTVSNLIDHYNSVAAQHERNAQKSKPSGLASMDYQERTKIVGENRKIFDNTVLRNRALEKANDLTERLPRGKANFSLMAKMHCGISESLYSAARDTHFLHDGGTGQVPTVDELMGRAKYHGNASENFTRRILKEKQEEQKRKEARRKA
ncbi:MAG: hypothetical protein WCX64_06220 [Candidatus Micrarchaeia archaeon]|jgi:hypothetical protein